MKTELQNSLELTKLCELIAEMSVAMLTLDLGNGLVSHPMTPLEMDSKGAIWFFTDLRTGKVGHLQMANLSFCDQSQGKYVSISGNGEIHNDREHIRQLWTPFANPWFPDGPESSNLVLLKFVPYLAEYWDAPHSKMVRMFAMAASVVAGKPVGLGEHGTLSDISKSSQSTNSSSMNFSRNI